MQKAERWAAGDGNLIDRSSHVCMFGFGIPDPTLEAMLQAARFLVHSPPSQILRSQILRLNTLLQAKSSTSRTSCGFAPTARLPACQHGVPARTGDGFNLQVGPHEQSTEAGERDPATIQPRDRLVWRRGAPYHPDAEDHDMRLW